MRLALNTFPQDGSDSVWRTGARKGIRVRDMDEKHLNNCINHPNVPECWKQVFRDELHMRNWAQAEVSLTTKLKRIAQVRDLLNKPQQLELAL